MHTSLPPCWLLLPFDCRLQRPQLPHHSHKTNEQANLMSSSTSVHIYLTTSTNIRLTHGSCTNVANTRFHKNGQAYQKILSENVFWLPYQIPSNPKTNRYIYMDIPMNCFLKQMIKIRSLLVRHLSRNHLFNGTFKGQFPITHSIGFWLTRLLMIDFLCQRNYSVQ